MRVDVLCVLGPLSCMHGARTQHRCTAAVYSHVESQTPIRPRFPVRLASYVTRYSSSYGSGAAAAGALLVWVALRSCVAARAY